MKPRCFNQRTRGLTLTEVLVSVAVVFVLAGLAYLLFHRPKPVPRTIMQNRAAEINCVNNLKQLGLACVVWQSDHGDKFPMQVPASQGGAMEEAARGNAARVFQIMSRELSTPKILVCPADADHSVAKGFGPGFDRSHISYFVGLDANYDDRPAMFLAGDDNFAIGRRPVKPGVLPLAANARVSWTAERHVNRGNVGLADGSVWQTDDEQLVQKLAATGAATTRLAIP
jgi:prepilin-type processing-associated H-X9-DG protein